MFAERTKKAGRSESAVVVPGSLVGCAAYLSSTKTRAVVKAAEPCKLVSFGPHELEKLLVMPPHCCNHSFTATYAAVPCPTSLL